MTGERELHAPPTFSTRSRRSGAGRKNHEDTLSAALYSADPHCGIRRLGRSCYLEVDLTTRQARLWDEPRGNDWRNRRERPSR